MIDKVYDKKVLVPHLESLIKAFGWSAIASSLGSALKRMTQKGSVSLRVVLELASAVQSSSTDEVSAVIVATVVEITTSMSTHKLTDDPEPLKSIWKLTICCETDQMPFLQWSSFVKRIDPSMLRDYVQAFDGLVTAKVDADGASSSEVAELVQSTLREIAKKRLDWVNAQRQTRSQSWEMPLARYPRDMRVQAFLRGPEVSMTLANFNDSRHASNYAHKHRHDVDNSSFTMTSSGATVTITKTRNIFNLNRNAGVSYEAEARALVAVCGEEFTTWRPPLGSLPSLPSLSSLLTSSGRGRTQITRRASLKRPYNDVFSIDSD